MSLKITFLKAFFNLSKNNETNIYKENTEHREPLAKAAWYRQKYRHTTNGTELRAQI